MSRTPLAKNILLVAASPENGFHLRVDLEFRGIKKAVERARLRKQFIIETREALTTEDFRQGLLESPQIVHFCGHGKGKYIFSEVDPLPNSQDRIVAIHPEKNDLKEKFEQYLKEEGLIFEDQNGKAKLVSAEALSDLFKLCQSHVECVVLNSCFSVTQAEAISQHIPYVIGMKREIGDKAAIEFSKGFYDALFAGRSIEDAFGFGRSAIQLGEEEIDEHHTPILIRKEIGEIRINIPRKTLDKVEIPFAEPDHSEPRHKRRDFIKYIIFGAGITTTLSLTPRIFRSVQNSLTTSSSSFDVVTVDYQGRVVERRQGQAKVLTENLGDNVELEMVAIPGGEFVMGSASGDGFPEERPQRSVSIEPFFMGKYPVTQAQWQAVAQLPKVDIDLELDPSVHKGPSRPVEWVSWQHAVEFCKRLSQLTNRNYRLPSEAEWEYACRATTTTAYHFGSVLTPDLANYDDPLVGKKLTTPVGSFNVANEFGLFDMHGNVWEWCADYWHINYEGAPSDGTPWITGGYSDLRVLRGGSWFMPMENSRSAERGNETLSGYSEDLGFRVAFSGR